MYLLLGAYAIYSMGTLSVEIQDIAHGSSYKTTNLFWKMINFFSIKTKKIFVVVIAVGFAVTSVILYSHLMWERREKFNTAKYD